MDFLDPRKQRAHAIRLIVGYILIGLAVLIATIILLYQAYGFGLGKNGEVVQNGLVFVSSQPGNAEIYVNGKLYKDTTNTRLQLPEGKYTLDIKRDGYTSWHRDISVVGGSVIRYDYPLLIPTNLTTTAVKDYASLPVFASESPDRHWAIVSQPGSVLDFDNYDLSDPKKVSVNMKSFSLPASLLTDATSAGQAWQLVEWSNDNRHVILQHTYTGGSEYILVDREDASKSVNLTKTLGLSAGQVVSLRDKKYDKYYVFDAAAKTVSSGTLTDGTTLTPVLTNVLAFKSYGNDMLLYATDVGAPAGQAMTMLKDGDVTYKIREIGPGAPYLLNLAQYSGDWYVAVGASSDNKVYVFKNPESVRKAGKLQNLVPVQVLRVTAPNYLEFSSNTRFIMIENATSFAVYDAETEKGYTYATAKPLDAPQAHATWMDGDRITYVTGGRQVIFDYDNINFQTLTPNAPAFLPFFDRDYRYLYEIAPNPKVPAQGQFTETSLLLPKDQ